MEVFDNLVQACSKVSFLNESGSMSPPRSEKEEVSKEELLGTFSDTKSYHHVLIASCDTRETYPNYTDLMNNFIQAVREQERAPSYLVFLPTEEGSKCDMLMSMAREVLAPKGVFVLSSPIKNDGDLGACKRAIEMLREDFETNLGVPFETAW